MQLLSGLHMKSFTLEKFKTRLEESDSKFVVGGFDDGSLVYSYFH